jgi:hypothetical protein
LLVAFDVIPGDPGESRGRPGIQRLSEIRWIPDNAFGVSGMTALFYRAVSMRLFTPPRQVPGVPRLYNECVRRASNLTDYIPA